ncbi:MAG: GAF domain-containing SpoIIE family protein phosphatase [Sumerlaeia bacterium]
MLKTIKTPEKNVEKLYQRIAELERDEALRKRAEKIQEVMYSISESVHCADNLSELYGKIHQDLQRILSARNLFIAQYYPENDEIGFPYSFDEMDSYHSEPKRLPHTMTSLVIRSGRPLLVDEQGYLQLVKAGKVKQFGSTPASWLGVPLICNKQTIGVIALQSYSKEVRYTEDDLSLMSFVSGQIANAIERKKAQQEREKYTQDLKLAYDRIKRDLNAAAEVQHSMLPTSPPKIPGLEFDWVFDSCDEVAGDMFNIIELDKTHVGLYILDVSGHGVQAALLSVSVDNVMSASLKGSGILKRQRLNSPQVEIVPPAEVASVLNSRFPMSSVTSQYFTFLYGILNLETLEFTYTRAGHPGPLLIDQGKIQRFEDSSCPAIGILENSTFVNHTLQLNPGAKVIFHTDGIEEVQNPDGEEFGEERIHRVLRNAENESISQAIQRLHAAAKKFAGSVERADDMTIVGLGLL